MSCSDVDSPQVQSKKSTENICMPEDSIYELTCEHLEFIEATHKLKDKNTDHLLFAQALGLQTPYFSDYAFLYAKDSLVENKILIPLTDNRYYKVKELSHSHPYLTKEAVKLLEEIGDRFQKNLRLKNQKEYAFYVSSALRTDESQNNLCRRNSNATRSATSHLYGTTFDISYKEFFRNNDSLIISYKNIQDILTQTLKELRYEKCCLVLREYKQQCFHITVMQ